jgi:hypothetical protein
VCIDLWYASALRKIGMPLIHDLQPALQVLGHDNCSTLWLSVEQRWLITINLFRLQPLCRQYSSGSSFLNRACTQVCWQISTCVASISVARVLTYGVHAGCAK